MDSIDLVGLVVQRCCEAAHDSPWRKLWGSYLSAAALVMAAAGGIVLAASVFGPQSPIAQPLAFALLFALAAAGLAGIAHWSGNARAPGRRAAGFLALVGFLALAYTGVVMNAMLRVSNFTTESAVASLKHALPKDATLVSLGPADPLFTYYYRDPIPAVPWPERAEALPEGVEYFCFSPAAGAPCWPAFPFEPIAEINCERSLASHPVRTTIVGRRCAPAFPSTWRPAGGAANRAEDLHISVATAQVAVHPVEDFLVGRPRLRGQEGDGR